MSSAELPPSKPRPVQNTIQLTVDLGQLLPHALEQLLGLLLPLVLLRQLGLWGTQQNQGATTSNIHSKLNEEVPPRLARVVVQNKKILILSQLMTELRRTVEGDKISQKWHWHIEKVRNEIS